MHISAVVGPKNSQGSVPGRLPAPLPPATEPPATAPEPPATGTEPPATAPEPPSSGDEPPATEPEPPSSGDEPPATEPGSPNPSTGEPSPLLSLASWTNPAASAALRSGVEILASVETGMRQHFTDVDRVRAMVADIRSANEVITAASEAIASDASKDNDQFLPLIARAGGGVAAAEARLSSKDIAATWPMERADILASVRNAKVISKNIADQLDSNFAAALAAAAALDVQNQSRAQRQ